MENKEFKKLFDEMTEKYGFESAFSGWFKESDECIVVLDLQKSSFSNSFYLNIKVYVHGLFGKIYHKSKDLVKKEIGNVFTRTPNEYNNILDLENEMESILRVGKMELLFKEFIVPFADKMLTRVGVKELAQTDEDFLLPAVKKDLDRLMLSMKLKNLGDV